ncbi:MAG: DUF2062 domain-containing protein [Paludibacteraceae bacterium]|nr:DUF2062 domain-containing protein [Paludibacteraceae bacterium]
MSSGNENGWKQRLKNFFTSDFNIRKESNARVASAVMIGVLVAILPIWGFQMMAGVALAQIFRLNRLVVLAASNISMPPMLFGILYASYECGRVLFPDEEPMSLGKITVDSALQSGACYLVGAIIFAIISAVIAYIISFLLLHLLRRKTQLP